MLVGENPLVGENTNKREIANGYKCLILIMNVNSNKIPPTSG